MLLKILHYYRMLTESYAESLCRLTIFLVYNAYHARSKTETWEKRLSCISWVFGCYKTMMQQVDGRQASSAPPQPPLCMLLVLACSVRA